MRARAVVVLLIAVLLAFQVVRTAMVRQSPLGTLLWQGHPESLLNQAMAEIGTIAARGEKLPPPVLAKVAQVARKMPLAPEPFLIHGALAQLDRRDSAAEQLYLEARKRDPRSSAARYFLAERYLRTARVEPALAEMAVLSRLTNGAEVFAPALATYARTPGAVAQLRRFFRTAPEFEPVVLSNLAGDANNLGLILALWSGPSGPATSAQSDWQARIVAQLVAAGDFGRAYSAWRQFAKVGSAAPGVFNPQFRELPAPPPFNWTFGSAGGLAHPGGNGQLEVIYFGRDEAVLAHQLLLLPAGRYQLAMQLMGNVEPGSGVAWTMECVPDKRPLIQLPVQRSASGRLQGSFTIPPGCRAQQLQLSGSLGDFPRTIEFTLGGFQLTKVAG